MCKPFHGYIDRPLVIWKRRRMIIGFFWGEYVVAVRPRTIGLFIRPTDAQWQHDDDDDDGLTAGWRVIWPSRRVERSTIRLSSNIVDRIHMWCGKRWLQTLQIFVYTHTHTHRLLNRYTTILLVIAFNTSKRWSFELFITTSSCAGLVSCTQLRDICVSMPTAHTL